MRYRTRELTDKEQKNIIRWLESNNYDPQPVMKFVDMPVNKQIKTLENYLTILKTKRSKHEQIHPQTGQAVRSDGSLDD